MRSFTNAMYMRGQFAPPVADHVNALVLAANTAERHAVPEGAAYVLFSATTDFWARFGDDAVTAAIPAGDVTDGAGSLLNPVARAITPGETHISLIAAAAGTVSLEFYS